MQSDLATRYTLHATQERTVKIAISSYSLRDHVNREVPYWEFPRYARDTFGVDAVEIIQGHVTRADAAGIDRLGEGLAAAGVALVSMPLDLGDISRPDDPARRDRDLRLIQLWIDAAASLGCPMVRVNSRDGDLELAIDGYRRLVDYAAPRGVKIAMENHGGFSADRPAAETILARVPGLATAPDFGNFKEAERYDFLAAMAPRAAIVHAKTLDFDAAGRMPAYDFARCVRIVADAGFAGYYSVEFEGKGDQIDGVRRSLALLQEIAAGLG
jgi:sugar phosphate isomerase/epimerase